MDPRIDQRTSPRIPVEIPVILMIGGQDVTCLTQDVTRQGLFVRTDRLRNLGQVLQLRIQPPPDFPELRLLAQVAHVLRPEQALQLGRTPGVGLMLRSMGPQEQRHWERFVDHAWQAYQQTKPAMPWARPSGAADPSRRRHHRYQAPFEVLLRTPVGLRRMVARDISAGGIFLLPEPLLRHNQVVQLVIVHPKSKERYPVNGRVVRVVERPPEQRGSAIQFTGVPEDALPRLQVFIESGASEPEGGGEEVVLVDPPPRR